MILAGMVGAVVAGAAVFLPPALDTGWLPFNDSNLSGVVMVGAILPISGFVEAQPEELRILTQIEYWEIRDSVPLSPAGPGANRSGETLVALRLAQDDFNAYLQETGAGWRLDIRIEDTAGDPETALQRVADLHEDGIDAIIGPASDAELLRIKDYADANGILVFSHGSTLPSLAVNDTIFRLVPSDGVQAQVLAEDAHEHIHRNPLVAIWRGDRWGDEMVDAVADRYESLGGTVEKAVRYDPKNADFAESVSLLAERVGRHLPATNTGHAEEGIAPVHRIAGVHPAQLLFPKKPVGVLVIAHQETWEIFRAAAGHDAFHNVVWLVSSTDMDGTGLLAGPCPYSISGVCVRKVSGTATLNDPVSRKFATPYVTMQHFAVPVGTAGERVIDAVYEEFGHWPDESTLAAYDAVWVMGLSILAADSTDAGSVALEIRGVTGEYDAALGTVRLDEAGDLVTDDYVVWKRQSSVWCPSAGREPGVSGYAIPLWFP